MGVRGRRAPTAQPSRVGKALPLFFGGTVARRLADRNPLTTTWSSSPDERLMVKLPISTCPLSTSLGRFDWRWRLLLTSGIIWLPEYFREAAPSRRLTKIQISLLQLRLPSDPRTIHYLGRIPRREVAKSHAVTRIAWTSPASRTKHSWSFPLHAGSHLIRGDALCHRAVLGRAAPRRGTGPLPSSDAEASTNRAPRPAVWASTALSSGRVVVRGADVTGGKRGAAGRAGASRGRQPLPTTPPTRTSLALWAPRTAVGAARPAPHIGARRRGPTL